MKSLLDFFCNLFSFLRKYDEFAASDQAQHDWIVHETSTNQWQK